MKLQICSVGADRMAAQVRTDRERREQDERILALLEQVRERAQAPRAGLRA